MKIKNIFFVILMLFLLVIFVEYLDMKMLDMYLLVLLQEYMVGMKDMYDKMMVVVNEFDFDKVFVKGMIVYYEGVIVMVEIEFKYGKDLEMRKFVQDIIKV